MPRKLRASCMTPLRITLWLALGALFVALVHAQELEPEQVASKDFYSTLGVTKQASEQEVKKAYRKLAQQNHPDKAPQDKKEAASQKFAEIAEAYEVLVNTDKRREYDLIRQEYLARNGSGGGSGGLGGGPWRPSHFDDSLWSAFGDPYDIFQEQFGAGAFDTLFGKPDFNDVFGSMYGLHGGAYGAAGASGAAFSSGSRGPSKGGTGEKGGRSSGNNDLYDQTFEEIRDFLQGGDVYRQFVKTTYHGDGSVEQEAQDFKRLPDGTFQPLGAPYPMTKMSGYPGFMGGGRAGSSGRRNSRIDNVLRVNERLWPGDILWSPGQRFYAELDRACNFRIFRGKGPDDPRRERVWETETYAPAGRCFAVLQGNGNMMVAEVGPTPDFLDGVLFNSNKRSKPHLESSSEGYYATIMMDDGNLVISEGSGPQDNESRCVWATFGCPENGPVPFRRAFRAISRFVHSSYCSLVGCDDEDDLDTDGATEGSGTEESGWKKLGDKVALGWRNLKKMWSGRNKRRRA